MSQLAPVPVITYPPELPVVERREDIAAAQARLDAAEATREQAATALADTELRAPSPGTIVARVREPGSMVASQSPVYSLSLDAPVVVRAYVGERVAPPACSRARPARARRWAIFRIRLAQRPCAPSGPSHW